MDITQLEKNISRLAAKQGYHPLIVSEEGLEKEIKRYPVAWIQLPLVLYVEGRDEGVICHQITVALLDNYSRHSFEDKSNRLAQMQADMVDIMTRLSSCEGIVELDAMTITPRVTHTTRHGDVAQICQASVVSYF
ncbi:MAG: hypothetical protein SNG38_00290 [Rikenellaceae bacterium]